MPMTSNASPMRALRGAATSVLSTNTDEITTNTSAVIGYPGTRYGRGHSGCLRRNTTTEKTSSVNRIQFTNCDIVIRCSNPPLSVSTDAHTDITQIAFAGV